MHEAWECQSDEKLIAQGLGWLRGTGIASVRRSDNRLIAEQEKAISLEDGLKPRRLLRQGLLKVFR